MYKYFRYICYSIGNMITKKPRVKTPPPPINIGFTWKNYKFQEVVCLLGSFCGGCILILYVVLSLLCLWFTHKV